MFLRRFPGCAYLFWFYNMHDIKPINTFEETSNAETPVRPFSGASSFDDVKEFIGAHIQVPEGLFQYAPLFFRQLFSRHLICHSLFYTLRHETFNFKFNLRRMVEYYHITRYQRTVDELSGLAVEGKAAP
jgi:hypothetical protein